MILKPIELTPAQETESEEIVQSILAEDKTMWDAVAKLIKDRDNARTERDNLERTMELISGKHPTARRLTYSEILEEADKALKP